jgi:hypothetical protein
MGGKKVLRCRYQSLCLEIARQEELTESITGKIKGILGEQAGNAIDLWLDYTALAHTRIFSRIIDDQ